MLLLLNLFNYIDRYNLPPVLKPIEADFGISSTTSGSLAFGFLIVYLITAPVFGWLADRYSRWVLVGVGMLVQAVGTFGSGWAPTFGFLLAARCIVGIGDAAYGPAAPTIISDLFPLRRRGLMLSFFYAAIPVGSALGYGIGGAMRGWTGDWRWGFHVITPFMILLGLACLFMKDKRPVTAVGREPRSEGAESAGASSPESGDLGSIALAPQAPGLQSRGVAPDDALAPKNQLPTLTRTESDASPTSFSPTPISTPISTSTRPRLADYLALVGTPSYTLNCIGMTALTFGMGGISYWMPYYLEGRGLDPTQSSLIFGGILVVAGLAATLAGGWVGDRLKPRVTGSYFVVSGVGMLAGVPLFIAILYCPFPACWGVLFLGVFALFFNTGPSNAILANVTLPRLRASAFALNILVIHLFGDALSPALIGWIKDTFSFDAAFYLLAGVMAAGSLFWLWGARYLDHDTAVASGE